MIGDNVTEVLKNESYKYSKSESGFFIDNIERLKAKGI